MEIKPGRYRTKNGQVIIIERKINMPVSFWQGYLEGYSKDRAGWNDQGAEMSGYKRWDLVERIEKSGE